ncbi:DUF7544 domain-containing protein [Natrarchaeobius oligotrophus]|uniref:Uncharacterized protein n=1 Tax=Natrarchaeobius chitinivorans TaxID=1679083 RepID=A0A3N6NKF6_NATCH|nr:hypothetical protein [Natrarchaeobius chitinivorans]RQG99722.1 hypothetical protein EA472_13795 [Natrarchaeobius chitinivorans]
MYAADNLSDAITVTRRYLSSLGILGWMKLALVVLFIGGLGIGNQFIGLDTEPVTEAIGEPAGLSIELLLAVGALVVFLAFRYLAAVLEFVFVESLRSHTLSVRRYARANLGSGLRLLAFRLCLWIALLAAVASVGAGAYVVDGVSSIDELTADHLLLGGAVAFVGYVGLWIVSTLTTAFVVPVMVLEDRGVIDAWRRFGSTLSSNWLGYLGFLVAAWVIGVALFTAFVLMGFVLGFIGLFVFIIFAALLAEADERLLYVAFALGLVVYLCYQYALSVVETPVRSYVRNYALLLLGDTDEALNLVPEQRAAVRSDRDASSAATDSNGRREPSTATVDAGGSKRTSGTGATGWSEPDDSASTTWNGPSSWDEIADDDSSEAGGSNEQADVTGETDGETLDRTDPEFWTESTDEPTESEDRSG